MRAALVTVVALASLAAGCGSASLTMRPGPRSFTGSDYDDVYDAWTRDADEFAFGRLSDILHVTATFEAWEFRWAYVVRYAQDHGLTTDARTQLLRASLADAQQHHRFFVTLVGSNWRESDITSERSAWRVLLVDDRGRATPPVEVEKIDRPSADERLYFPSVNTQRQTFRIVFPARHEDGTPSIPAESPFVILRFTGAAGTVDLKWEFVRTASEPGD